MFNNPFDSFHKTVGKAKKEREQLDRLLTVSTPGELALVALTAFVLLVFAAWLLFGSVARNVTVDALLFEPSAYVPDAVPARQAMVLAESDLAREVSPGTPVVLEVVLINGQTRSLKGRVANAGPVEVDIPVLSRLPPPSGLPLVPSMTSLRVVLDEALDFASLDRAGCRIVIELGSQSPLAFFAQRPS